MPPEGCRVRRAALADAAAACEVVRRSIVELCEADHERDAETIVQWLANKTPANFESWIRSAQHIALVTEDADGAIAGFALLNRSGKLALLYVSPEARFRGFSKALLAALEHEAVSAGMREIRLESTATAERFYAAAGFVAAGDPVPGFGRTLGRPMVKALASR